MRLALAAVLALAACGSEPAPIDAAAEAAPPDAPPADLLELDAPPDAAPDAAPDAVLQDAPPDEPAPIDAAPDATPDAAVDVDPRDTAACRAVNATCDGRRVNVQGGERDGGITYHCGACGVTCAADEVCLTCVCTRR